MRAGPARRPRLSDATWRGRRSGFYFSYAFGNGALRQTTRAAHFRYPPMTQGARFVGRHEPARPFVQQRLYAQQLRLKFQGSLHSQRSGAIRLPPAAVISLRFPIGTLLPGFGPAIEWRSAVWGSLFEVRVATLRVLMGLSEICSGHDTNDPCRHRTGVCIASGFPRRNDLAVSRVAVC